MVKTTCRDYTGGVKGQGLATFLVNDVIVDQNRTVTLRPCFWRFPLAPARPYVVTEVGCAEAAGPRQGVGLLADVPGHLGWQLEYGVAFRPHRDSLPVEHLPLWPV